MSSDNRVEENDIGGNVNGVLAFADGGHGNVVRHNIITGNPPAQVQKTFGSVAGANGADIHDLNTSPGTNTYEDNFCLTYVGPGTPPCPNIPNERRDKGEDY